MAFLRNKTDGFANYSIKYSPFFPDRLAVASAQNFGLVGNGRLHLLQQSPQSGLRIEKM